MDKKGLIRYLKAAMPNSFKVSKITTKLFNVFKVSKMTTKFLTRSESAKGLTTFQLVQSHWFKTKLQLFIVRF